MKKFISILLLSLFLCGCTVPGWLTKRYSKDNLQEQLWDVIEIGQEYTFELTHKRISKIKYYKIEQITQEEYQQIWSENVI